MGIDYNKTVIEDDPVYVICEDNDEYLVDVITGNRYKRQKNNYYNRELSNELILGISKEIPASQVVEMLRGLSQEEITRYTARLYQLNNAIAIGYQKDMLRIESEKIQKQKDDDYIKSFRKKYGR